MKLSPTIIYIWFLLISIIFTSCSRTEKANTDQTNQQILDFIVNYNRFEASDYQKQQADSVGRLLIEKKNNQQNRELLQKFISQVMPDTTYFYALKEKAEKGNDFTHLGKAHELLARYYDRIYLKDSTLYNYTKSEMYYRQSNDTLNLINVLVFKSITLLNDRFYTEAQSSLLEAISYEGFNQDMHTKFTITLMLGNALTGLSQYQEAHENIQQALIDIDSEEMQKIHPQEKRIALRIMTKQALIINYIALKDYETAKKIAKETIDKDINLTTTNYYRDITHATILQLLSQAKILSSELKGVENDLNSIIDIYEKSQMWDEQSHVKTLLADYYFRTNNSSKAFQILDQVIKHAKKSKLLFQEKEALFLLLSNTEDPINDYFSRYVEVSELINDEAANINNTFARIKFESDNLLLKNQELESQKKIIINISIALILLILLGFMTYFFRQKSKQLRIVKLLQKDTEKYYNSILAMKQELSLAKSVERKKLAQDLHDGVLNKIFVTRFLLLQLSKENLEEKIGVIIEEVTNIEAFLRDFSHLLSRDSEFKTSSFDSLLSELIDLQNRNKKIEFILSIDSSINLDKLGTKTKIHLYRILQEALQNAQKYSNAEKCWITFKQVDGNKIELRVQDNGIGFDVTSNFDGIGLNNIKERAQFIRANLSITSQPNNGTTIILVFASSFKV
ncbi:tetratricopeptide repeat-containing sensor histidine kinase [Myroides sp. LJL115]